jgi:hypothetical protein
MTYFERDVSTYGEVAADVVTSVACHDTCVVLIQGRTSSESVQRVELSREQLDAAHAFAKACAARIDLETFDSPDS